MKRSTTSGISLWVAAMSSFLASGYSVLAFLRAALRAVTPNYLHERAQVAAGIWGGCTVVFFLIGVLLAVVIWRRRKRD